MRRQRTLNEKQAERRGIEGSQNIDEKIQDECQPEKIYVVYSDFYFLYISLNIIFANI